TSIPQAARRSGGSCFRYCSMSPEWRCILFPIKSCCVPRSRRPAKGSLTMANEEQLQLLRQGVKAWYAWRRAEPLVVPDLREADLREADLSAAFLRKANLARANLSKANLSTAFFLQADLG